MKKLLTIIILLLPFLFIGKVKAFDEYRIYLQSSTSIIVRKTTGDGANDFVPVDNYSDILTYSDGLLTLNESYYFDEIFIRFSGATITSNNKHVNLNTIYDTSSQVRDLTIDNLNSSVFVSAFRPLTTIQYSNNEKYNIYSNIRVTGDLLIKNSKIDMTIVNSQAFNIYDNGNITSRFGSITVLNSDITSEGGLYVDGANKDLLIKDSTINAVNQYGQGYGLGIMDGKAEIIDSTIKGNIDLLFWNNGYITNSTIELNDWQLALDPPNVLDCYVKNSTLKFKNTINIGYYLVDSNYNLQNVTDLTLDNSHIVDGGYLKVVLALSSKLKLINGSTFESSTLEFNHTDNDSLLSVIDSEFNANSIDSEGSILFKDSKINIPDSGSIKGSNSITFDNINDLKLDHISTGDLTINSVNVDLAKSLTTTGDVDINDSIFKSNGTRVGGNFTLDNSIYKTHYLNEEKTYSPFIVVGDVDISNSSFVSESDGTVPSVLVKGDIDIKDSSFKDNNKHVLDISDVQVSNSNFLSSTETFGNASYVNVGDVVKTTTLNGELSNYSEISKHYEVVIKVVNGTWGNGTSDDITLKILIGDEVDGYLPTDMIPNNGYTKGKWEKDDDKYVYTFVKKNVENPKTGVISTLGLLIITSFLLTYLIRNKNKFSVFRRI